MTAERDGVTVPRSFCSPRQEKWMTACGGFCRLTPIPHAYTPMYIRTYTPDGTAVGLIDRDAFSGLRCARALDALRQRAIANLGRDTLDSLARASQVNAGFRPSCCVLSSW